MKPLASPGCARSAPRRARRQPPSVSFHSALASLAAAAGLFGTAVQAQTVTLDAAGRGNVWSNGANESSYVSGTGERYLTGRSGDDRFRGFFVFNLPAAPAGRKAISASLKLWCPPDIGVVGSHTQKVSAREVDPPVVAKLKTGTAQFDDLGFESDDPILGFRNYSDRDRGGYTHIILSPAGLDRLNLALGGEFGLKLWSDGEARLGEQNYIFEGSGTPDLVDGHSQLVVQWGLCYPTTIIPDEENPDQVRGIQCLQLPEMAGKLFFVDFNFAGLRFDQAFGPGDPPAFEAPIFYNDSAMAEHAATAIANVLPPDPSPYSGVGSASSDAFFVVPTRDPAHASTHVVGFYGFVGDPYLVFRSETMERSRASGWAKIRETEYRAPHFILDGQLPPPIEACLATPEGTRLTIPFLQAEATCGIPTVTATRSDGRSLDEPFPCGLTTITWLAYDCFGNTSAALTQSVTVKAAAIIAKVFEDANVNGQDDDALVRAGVPVTLTGQDAAGNAVNLTQTAGPDGVALFDCLPGGEYTVSVPEPTADCVATTATAVALAAGNCEDYRVSFGIACTTQQQCCTGSPAITTDPGDPTRVTMIRCVEFPDLPGRRFTVHFWDRSFDQVFGAGDPPANHMPLFYHDAAGARAAAETIAAILADAPEASSYERVGLPGGPSTAGSSLFGVPTRRPDGACCWDTMIDYYLVALGFPFVRGPLVQPREGEGSVPYAVILEETAPPVFLHREPAEVTACLATSQGTALAIVPPAVRVNCGSPTITGARTDGRSLTDPFPCGTTTITWNATDTAGQSATPVTQAVTVTGATVCARKFYDLNGNGLDDDGQPLAGWSITLAGVDSAGNPVRVTRKTGEDGSVCFTCVPQGSYTVSEAQPGGAWVATTPPTVDLELADCAWYGVAFGNAWTGVAGACPRSFGFWKTHDPCAEADCGELLEILTSYLHLPQGKKADASLTLGYQFAAAFLNFLVIGPPDHPAVEAAFESAWITLGGHPPGSGVAPKSADGKTMLNLASVLEAYNTAYYSDCDGDGFTPEMGDCNDSRPDLHPGAAEVPGNGIDDDCDGKVDEAP